MDLEIQISANQIEIPEDTNFTVIF